MAENNNQPKKNETTEPAIDPMIGVIAERFLTSFTNNPQMSKVPLQTLIERSFTHAKAFCEMSNAYMAGQPIPELAEKVQPPEVEVGRWDAVTNSVERDDYGPVKVTVKPDIYAYAPGLNGDHPANEGYIKGRLQLGMPIPAKFKDFTNKYAAEYKEKKIEHKVNLVGASNN